MLRVDFVCGLLGVGKTTLIRKMLDTVYAGKKVAVIENEVGAVNLDAGELSRPDIRVEELTSGCVCCTLKAGFYDALRIFSGDSSVEYMIVEPSGIADITDLLDVCETMEGILVNRRIMVVKAPKILRFLKAAGTSFRGQIAEVDTIYLNFSDQLEASALENLKQELWRINPMAVMVDGLLDEITAGTFPDREDPFCSPAPKIPKNGSEKEKDASTAARRQVHPQEPSRGAVRLRMQNPGSGKRGGSIRMLNPGIQQSRIVAAEIPWPDRLPAEYLSALTDYLKTLDEESGVLRAKGYLRTDDGFITRVDLAAGDVFTKKMLEFDESRLNRLVLIGYSHGISAAEQTIRKLCQGTDTLCIYTRSGSGNT